MASADERKRDIIKRTKTKLELLCKNDITDIELQTNISESTLRRLINTKNNSVTDFANIALICEYLCISTDSLFFENHQTDTSTLILQYAQQLTREKRDAILNLLITMTK